MGNLHGWQQQQQLQEQFVQQRPEVPHGLLGLPQPQAKVLPCGIQPLSPQIQVVPHSCCGLQWVQGLNKGFAVDKQVESIRC